MIDREMTKEEAIGAFRRVIAEQKNITEEEAGADINESVEISLELLDPLYELHSAIAKRSEKSGRDAMKMTMVAIIQLLSSYPPGMRKDILRYLADQIDGTEHELTKFYEQLGKQINKKK